MSRPARARLTVASGNRHKIAEFDALFQAAGLNAEVARFEGALPEETALSFLGNARLKAWHVANATGTLALADDSGLCIAVMSGAPGPLSARWSGPQATDGSNRALVLQQLAGETGPRRAAQFECVLILAVPAALDPLGVGFELTGHGAWTGRIAEHERGEYGFGYDSIFLPDGLSVSAAELTPAEKNSLSHRTRAFSQLTEAIAASSVAGLLR